MDAKSQILGLGLAAHGRSFPCSASTYVIAERFDTTDVPQRIPPEGEVLLPTQTAPATVLRDGTPSVTGTGTPALSYKPVRVMHLLNRMEVGGTELNALRTAELLDHRQVDLEVAILGPDGPLLERYERLGIPIHRLSIRNLYGVGTMREASRFAGILRRGGFEILHAHDVYANIFGAAAGRLAGVRGVITSRRWWKRTPRRGLLPVNRVAYSLSHRVVANTPAVARMLSDDEHVPAARVTVVPNFLESAAFDAAAEGHWDREPGLAAIPADAVVIGAVGRLNAVKDLGTLLRAAATLPASVHVVLVGDGPERDELQRLAFALSLQGRVHFVGERPARPSFHHRFDISTLTSVSEGLPNSVLEAMAASRAVVASSVGGVPDLIRHGETGLLFPPGDVASLAAHLGGLVGDRAERERLGRNARDHVAANYSADAVLSNLYQLYRDLARPPA